LIVVISAVLYVQIRIVSIQIFYGLIRMES
jgi:hypothetical protein